MVKNINYICMQYQFRHTVKILPLPKEVIFGSVSITSKNFGVYFDDSFGSCVP